MRLKTNSRISLAAGFLISSATSASSVTTGQFVLDFDETALINLTSQLKNNAWWNSTDSADKGEAEMRTLPAPSAVPDSFVFQVLGSSIPSPPAGLPGRNPQPSTLTYTGDPTTGTGAIGLAGAHVADGNFTGELIFGDYDLRYDATRVGNAADSSGWFLTNHISFTSESWDLTNVSTTIIGEDDFSLSGDVALTSASGGFLGGVEGTDIGNFTFSTIAESTVTDTRSPRHPEATFLDAVNADIQAILDANDEAPNAKSLQSLRSERATLSTVPLPPAISFFAASLIGLAAFAKQPPCTR